MSSPPPDAVSKKSPALGTSEPSSIPSRPPLDPTPSSIAPAGSFHPLPPPPPAPDFSPPPASSSSVPPAAPAQPVSLDQLAQLSAGEKAQDWVYRGFWWTMAVPGRIWSAATTKASEKALEKILDAAADKGLSLVTTPQPQTHLHSLRDCLFKLHVKLSSTAQVDPELKQLTILELQQLLNNQQIYFNEALNPRGWRAALNYQQQSQFKTLLFALQTDIPIEAAFVKPLLDFIETCWGYQQQFHKVKAREKLLGKDKPVTAQTALARSPKKVRASRPSPAVQAAPKPAAKNPIHSISGQIDELKSVSSKIVLALLILPESCLKTESESGGLISSLIKKSKSLDPLKNSDELFQEHLFIALDNAELNFFQNKWKKLTYKIVAPLVIFMMDYILERMKDRILYMIGLSPDNRLKLLVDIFIKPSQEFICKLQSEYIAIAENKIGTTPDTAISHAIIQLKIEDKNGKYLTPRDLIDQFVGSLMNQYAPSFNWAGQATSFFEKRYQESKFFVAKLLFSVLSYLTLAVHLVSAPLRWCVYQISLWVLKRIAASKIHSKLQDTKDSSWDFGRLALRSLYKMLHDKLQKSNRSKLESESEEKQRKKLALEQTAFVDKSVQNNIKELLSSFFKLLPFQGSDVIDLHTKLDPSNTFERGKSAALGLALAPGIQKATEQIIQGLQVFLSEETFATAIFDVLEDVCKQSLRFNPTQDDKTKREEDKLTRLETEFYEELQDAVKRGISDIVNEDPSSPLQAEADLFIDGVKYDIEQFHVNFEGLVDLTPDAIKKMEQSRDKFLVAAFRRRFDRAFAQKNDAAQVHISAIAERFYQLRQPVQVAIGELVTISENQQNLKELVEEIAQLTPPLQRATTKEPQPNATAFYKELQSTLGKIRNKSYPPSVQDLISKLQDHFDTWKTESDKRTHQPFINGTVTALAKAVERAIEANKAEYQKLEKEKAVLLTAAKNGVAELMKWSKQLQYFECKVENKDNGIFKEMIARYAEGNVAPIILTQLEPFFLFLGKSHNLKGLFWYVVKAYLEQPEPSSEEFKKILTEMKDKITPPPCAPS